MERTVREAAAALQKAIADAITAGYRVDWPGSAADLDKIAISETGAVKPEAPVRAPVSTLSRPVSESTKPA